MKYTFRTQYTYDFEKEKYENYEGQETMTQDEGYRSTPEMIAKILRGEPVHQTPTIHLDDIPITHRADGFDLADGSKIMSEINERQKQREEEARKEKERKEKEGKEGKEGKEKGNQENEEEKKSEDKRDTNGDERDTGK